MRSNGYNEGYEKGKQDAEKHNARDVYRHIHGWAWDFVNYENGYNQGYTDYKIERLKP